MTVKSFFGNLGCRTEGGALVEACLTLPTLFLFVLGAVEFSRLAYTSLEVVSAAKAGVAYGAQNGGVSTDTSGITMAATTDAANVTSLKVISADSTYACSDGSPIDSSKALNTQCASSHMIQTLTVHTQAKIDPLIHVPGLPSTYTIDGQASQACLQ